MWIICVPGISPMVTLFHWDTPLSIEDDGAWGNDTIIEKFKDYAKLCFDTFGDRVSICLFHVFI